MIHLYDEVILDVLYVIHLNITDTEFKGLCIMVFR